MTVLTQAARPGEAIMSEGQRSFSRDNVTIAAEQTVLANALLGKKAVSAGVVVTTATEGTGNGAITMADPPISSKAKDGVYTAVCVTAASDAGTFRVEDPDGKHIGNATVGVAFDKEIKFTIADGSTDHALGKTFRITVALDAVDFVHVPFNHDGTDGSETPVAYSIYPVVTGVGETKKTAAIVRQAELNGNCIAWPTDIDAAEKADAIQALAAQGIIVRY